MPSDFSHRDALVAAFRRQVWGQCGYTPFPHQAAPILATEGWDLTNAIISGTSTPFCDVLVPDPAAPDDATKAKTERRALIRRPNGPAHTTANLGSYKVGKSFGAGALFAPGFACLPNVVVQLVGVEYKTSRFEFEYLADTLLSKSQGMGFKYRRYQNDPRNGRMVLELRNGMLYEGMSWERKEALKGAEITAYLWNEAYMLPGLEVINTTKQNLRKTRGFNYLSTTPDRPWVNVFHDYGHGRDPDWFCSCGADGSLNPHTFSLTDMMRDCPEWEMVPASVMALAHARGLEPGGRMTRERFAISWQGRIGDFVGRVYNYQRGERIANPTDHPHLFQRPKDGAVLLSPSPSDVRLPQSATIIVGADTGTFMSAVIAAAFDDWLIFLEEFPNYRYVAGEIELLDLSLPKWTVEVRDRARYWSKRSKARGWCDPNSQFKVECKRYGLTLFGNPIGPEARTEILREYFQAHRVLFMPWLVTLPYEIELARWPDDVSASGRYSRLKEDDHTCDPAEHIASRRPRSRKLITAPSDTLIQRLLRDHRRADARTADPHLGTV